MLHRSARRGVARAALALAAMGSLVSPGPAQDESDPLGHQLEELDSEYQRLRVQLEEHRIDHATDSFQDILTKRNAVQSGLEGMAQVAYRASLDAKVIGSDVVRFWYTTSPRLTGRVLTVGGEDGEYGTLAGALINSMAGDLLLLAEGNFSMTSRELGALQQQNPDHADRIAQLRRGQGYDDIAIVGLGRERTTLSLAVSGATRLRLESMSIACLDEEFLDLRLGGSAQVRDCHISGYNSGAGGSKAVFGSDGTVLYFENCEFSGGPGRGSGNGDAFDLRGDYFLYCRACLFVENDEIVRADGLVVMDSCRQNEGQRSYGVTLYSRGSVLVRDSDEVLRPGSEQEVTRFEISTDDPLLVRGLLGGQMIDPGHEALAERLQLARNLPYWIGMISSRDLEISARAIETLLDLVHAQGPGLRVPDLSAPPELEARIQADVIAGRWASWYEQQRSRLVWREKRHRYELDG